MKTLIYARYSSQLQNPRSIADQLAACRARCEAEGWEIAGEFSDAAISGAAGVDAHQRPGLHALFAQLEQPGAGIEQVLTESTDRLARHQGDDFALRERIQHAGARLFTLMQGPIDDITGTLHGLFAAKTRADLAQRVRRGHTGNIAEGRVASGIAYGYRRVTGQVDAKGEPVRGLREIDPITADVVRRVFREYLAGKSPRAIALGLNQDGIPAPRGGLWRASTLAGHRHAGFGVLVNPIYVGRLEYGRTRGVVDPRTRRRATRLGAGPVAHGEAPHLRIVTDAEWNAAQRQLAARSLGPPERQRRPKRLLSGLAMCGSCGARMVITSGDYFGCGGRHDSGLCENNQHVAAAELDRRVLAELAEQMLAPDVVAAYLDEYGKEHARRARELDRERHALERRRDEAARKVANLVAAIADGGGAFAEIRDALAAARSDHAAAEKALAASDAMPAIALHPGLARQYKAAIADLAAELADPTTRELAAPKLRALIARVEVTPRGTRKRAGVDIKVVRHIDEVLALTTRRTA